MPADPSLSAESVQVEEWVVYDPYDGHLTYDTEAEATAAANSIIEAFCADAEWDDSVEQVFVAKVTGRAAKKVLGVRADMTPEAWDRLTGENLEADEWWEFHIEPVTGASEVAL